MTRQSIKILKYFVSRKSLSAYDISVLLDDDYLNIGEIMLELKSHGYIRPSEEFSEIFNASVNKDSIGIKEQYVITQEGKAYLENLHSTKFKNNFELILQIVTTGIAVAAFIKSFFF